MSLGKILIVDDTAEQRMLFRKMLENSDYSVVEAVDGEDGLQKVKTEMPDVVITDLSMPKIDGFEFIRILKTQEDTKYIPVIAASATFKEVVTKTKVLIEAGAEELFYMPENLEDLLAKVAVMMRIRKIYLDLLEKNKQLKQFNEIAVGRELKMVELKDKVQKLEEELAKLKK